MPFVELPGVHLWYTDTNETAIETTPVVFLHPRAGTHESWAAQVPAFVAAGFRCVTYDRRGWGRSTPDQAVEQPGNSGQDLHGLLRHLGLVDVHLVGTANGGTAAVDYALAHPNAVRSLVLDNSYAGLQDDASQELMKRIHPDELQSVPRHVKELSPEYRASHIEGVERWRRIAETSLPQALKSQPPQARLLPEMLRELRMPVLLISGGASMGTPPPVVRRVASFIPGSRLEILHNAGQLAHWERPEEWNSIVLEFVQKNS